MRRCVNANALEIKDILGNVQRIGYNRALS
jgi:hypothetical protein